MDLASFLARWVHLVAGVGLVGYALFWTIVAVPDPPRANAASRAAFLARVKRLRWPPFGPLRLPLVWLGWGGIVLLAGSGVLATGADASVGPLTHVLSALAVLAHLALVLRPSLATAVAFHVALYAVIVAAAVPAPGYREVVLALHVLTAATWLGHMFFWSVVVGPLLKRVEPAAERDALRAASHRWGALGTPALFVLFPTGTMLLLEKGAVPAPFPWKLALVGGMVLYQVFVGHRRAPRLIWADMFAALAVLALSVWVVHGS